MILKPESDQVVLCSCPQQPSVTQQAPQSHSQGLQDSQRLCVLWFQHLLTPFPPHSSAMTYAHLLGVQAIRKPSLGVFTLGRPPCDIFLPGVHITSFFFQAPLRTPFLRVSLADQPLEPRGPSWSDLSIFTLVGLVNRSKGLGSRGDHWGFLSDTRQSCWPLGWRPEQWGWRTLLDSEIACCLPHSVLLLEIIIVWCVCVLMHAHDCVFLWSVCCGSVGMCVPVCVPVVCVCVCGMSACGVHFFGMYVPLCMCVLCVCACV